MSRASAREEGKMVSRGIIIAVWTVAFCVVNVMAKVWVGRLPSSEGGVPSVVRAVLLSPWLYGLVALYASCAVLYMMALRLMPLSVAGPVFTMLGAALGFVLGVVVFHEAISPVKTVGIGLCLTGAVVLFWQG